MSNLRIEVLDRYAREAYERAITGSDYNVDVLEPFGRLLSGDSKSPRVLDLASGRGASADYLERSQGLEVVRADLSLCGLKLGRNARVRAFADTLPFRSNSFEGVHMKDALVHMPNLDKLMSEIVRVLMPGGKALIASEYPPKANNFLYRVKGNTNSTRVYIAGEPDYLNHVGKLMENPNVARLTPPFYSTHPSILQNSAQVHGLTLINSRDWVPQNKSDWHGNLPIPVKRFVMTFEKY